jgi:hypothetical protein
MGIEVLQAMFSALPQIMAPELTRQWNRTVYFLASINAVPGAITDGAGKNASFDVEFTGATAGTVAEGSDVGATEFNSDVNEPMTMPWCSYRSSFQISERLVNAARSSVGFPDALKDLFGERILGCQAKLAQAIEIDAISGTGVDTNGNPALVGIFGGALSASGVYGGLNPATYSEWAGNVLANGGTVRALTPALLEAADAQIFTAASVPWNLIVTTAGVTSKYAQLFTMGVTSAGAITRMNDNPNSPQYGLGVPNDNMMQQTSLLWKGQRVYRNPQAPTGKLAFLNTDFIKIKYLPYVPNKAAIEYFQSVGLQGSSGGDRTVQPTGIGVRLVELAKTGDSYKVSMQADVAMAVLRRNACALVQDISEV